MRVNRDGGFNLVDGLKYLAGFLPRPNVRRLTGLLFF